MGCYWLHHTSGFRMHDRKSAARHFLCRAMQLIRCYRLVRFRNSFKTLLADPEVPVCSICYVALSSASASSTYGLCGHLVVCNSCTVPGLLRNACRVRSCNTGDAMTSTVVGLAIVSGWIAGYKMIRRQCTMTSTSDKKCQLRKLTSKDLPILNH